MIIGVDEAGRGALAGPISVGLSLIPDDIPLHTFQYLQDCDGDTEQFPGHLRQINDSKQLTEFKREKIYSEFIKFFETRVLYVPPHLIDQYGLSRCIKICIVLGIIQWVPHKQPSQKMFGLYLDASLSLPKVVDKGLVIQLIEHNRIDLDLLIALEARSNSLFAESIDVGWLQEYFCHIGSYVKGDYRFLSVAVASIAAKVERDSLMRDLSEEFPVYKWGSNKGYGSRLHREMINLQGPSMYHRTSFLTKIIPESPDK